MEQGRHEESGVSAFPNTCPRNPVDFLACAFIFQISGSERLAIVTMIVEFLNEHWIVRCSMAAAWFKSLERAGEGPGGSTGSAGSARLAVGRASRGRREGGRVDPTGEWCVRVILFLYQKPAQRRD